MPIPSLDNRGLLPAGCHKGTFGEVEHLFLFNPHREALYWDVRKFIDQELRVLASGLKLVLGGSFFSDKPTPADIEGTVYLPVADIAKYVNLLGISQRHSEIKRHYRADFYISIDAPGCNDFGLFFQYVGPKTAHMKGLKSTDPRGVIEVESWELG